MIKEADDTAIREGAALLRSGGLVAFPTETVYGLGADATDDQAVAKIFAAKDRPDFNPLIVHVPNVAAAQEIVQWTDRAQLLADRFWPGALTFILRRGEDSAVSLLVSAGLETVAVRVPDHPIAQKLLAESGLPIAAPSANRSGKISPTMATHVEKSLGSNVDLILDGGPCRVGLESTVIDLTADRPTVLRPGGIDVDDLKSVLGPLELASEDGNIKSPGMLSQHYAPNAPIRLNATAAEEGETLLAFGGDAPGDSLNLSPSGDLIEAAANLFSMLHELDQPESGTIAGMPIPDEGLGRAINDRLRRAAR